MKKARETLGDAAPKFNSGAPRSDHDDRGSGTRGGRGGGVLGKRRRDEESSDSDVPDDVKSIPMPRDTPPPIPKDILDKWYQARRDKMGVGRNSGTSGTSANSMPLGQNDRRAALHKDKGAPGQQVQTMPEKPKVEAQVVYESKPIIRDLRKEAVAFVPASVRVNLDKGKGIGGLLEPEEADRLERAGYLRGRSSDQPKEDSLDEDKSYASRNVMLEEIDHEDD